MQRLLQIFLRLHSFRMRQRAECEPQVAHHGRDGAVVAAHDVEAFDERGAVVARGESLVEVVHQCQVGVMQVPGLLHDADAPVEVRREAVAQVIVRGDGTAGEEGLVAHEHAVPEALPREVLGRGQAAHPQEMALTVDQRRVAIEDVGRTRCLMAGGHRVDHAQQGVVLVEAVACVQETHVVARGKGQPFVHGIIEPLVRLAHHGVYVVTVTLDDAHRVVRRGAVDEDILHILVRLCDDALDGVLQHRSGIVGNGDEGELWMKVGVHVSVRGLGCRC